jgi:chromosome segregation ATPase
MAVRAFAVEQWRAESAKDPVAAKRLERLERQWFTQCEATANDLDRLQATLKAEAAQLDERSRQLRHDVVASEARTAVLDNRAAEIEREEQVVAAERERSAGDLDAARARQEIAEAKTAAAQDKAERLARLLIDATPASAVIESSQAA